MPSYDKSNKDYDKISGALRRESTAIDASLVQFRLREAVDLIVNLARTGNRFLNETEPWKLYKQSEKDAGQIIGLSVQIVGSVAVLLQPFLPETSSRILKVLVKKTKLSWKSGGTCFIKPGTRILPLEPLFHKVSAVDLRDRLAKIRSIETPEVQI